MADQPGNSPGTLFVVATPIGNLEDVTLRALRVLREVDLIAAEDTRHSRLLLDHHGIDRPLTSLHDHNEEARIPGLLQSLTEGRSVALITDAGTPVMSDPGFRLIRAARDAGLPVEVVPGPSAILAAVAGSGVPAETFAFLGFPPRKARERDRWARHVLALPIALVFFESPHRLVATLRSLAALAPMREASVARELTKRYEEFVRAPLNALADSMAARDEIRGEVTVVVAGPGADPSVLPSADAFAQQEDTRSLDVEERTMPTDEGDGGESGAGEPAAIPFREPSPPVNVEAEIARLKQAGMKDKEVAKEIARLTGGSAREIYASLIREK